MKRICEGFVRKALLSIIVVLFTFISFGATYYLAPNGNDSNAGTISSPWFTLNKVWTVLKAGDTVYLRGGTYAFNSQQNLRGKNGVAGSLINIFAYPNETPILTKSSSYPATYGILFTGNYFFWKGIEITGYTQPSGSVLSYGFRVENSSYNTFENLKVHGNGCGMTLVNNGYTLHATNNLIVNCDFYENQDPLTTLDPYGNADGLSVAWITHPEDVNTVRGCRFYWNSDDGFDMFSNDGQVIIENCQSFYNGYIPGTFTAAGDGIGYKFGNNLTDLRTSLKRIARNCISVKNRTKGYSTNGIYGLIELDNCTAYSNGNIGIHLADYNLTHVAKNCLSFSNATNTGLSTTGTYLTNSWQNGLTVSTADFKSLDTNLLLSGRQSDGSLVSTDFLKLVSTSKLIDKGTAIGLAYSGSAPDINSFEYESVAVSNVSIAKDEYISICSGTNYNGWTTSGTYKRILTAKSGVDSVVVTYLTVNPLPVVSFISGISSAPVGSKGNLYTTQSGMSNYKWNVSSGGSLTTGGTTTTNTAVVTWNTTGTQYVSVNYSNSNGCSALLPATYTVTVYELPTIYNVTGGGSYCSNGSGVQIGLSGSQIGVNYQLKLNGTNIGTSIAGNGSALSFGLKTSAGTYTVMATNSSTTATGSMNGSATVTINPLPVISFANGVNSVNVGVSGNVYATQAGMTNYKWNISSGGTITSGGSSTSNMVAVTWNALGTQSVSINYTDANGCSASVPATYNVNVSQVGTNAVVLPSVYSVTGGGSFCLGSLGVLIGLNSSQVGVNYQLFLNSTKIGNVVAGTGNALSFGYNTQAGTYTVIGTNATTTTTNTMLGNAVVTINPVYSTTENITINQGQNYLGWTASGKYSRTLSSIYGCDSVVTTNLTVIAETNVNTQKIQLKKGNNLMSSYLMPSNIDAGVLIKPLIDRGIFVKMYDEDNSTIEYNSNLGSWTNDIGAFEKTEGYLINVTANCELQITGSQVGLPLGISLHAGWNIISYPRSETVNAMSVVQSLINQNKLVKVQDELGNSIENLKSYGGWKNNIGNFVPGKAYKVYVNSDAVLTIQSTYTKSALNQSLQLVPEHFVPVYDGNGLNHMNINLVGIKSTDFSVGDEIAAFDGNSCVGALKISQEQITSGSVSLIASSKSGTQINDGFIGGDVIKLIVWKNSLQKEIEIVPEVLSGELKYTQNGSSIAQLNSSLLTDNSNMSALINVTVYPNPSNGLFSVKLSELPNFNSKIEILDISGRLILSRQITGTLEEFNLSNVSNGMYLIKIIFGSSQMLHKLIINN